MGIMPSLGGVDVARTVDTVINLLTRINHKLSELIALETARQEREAQDAGCGVCNESGRLRCPAHGPVRVPDPEPPRCGVNRGDGPCSMASGHAGPCS